MNSKCFDCPITKEYIDVGCCPNCRANNLHMNTTTHLAICDKCKATFALSMAIERLCQNDENNNRYKIRFDIVPDKQQLLDLSKLIGFTAGETYCLFKN